MEYKSITTEFEHVASEANAQSLSGWRVVGMAPHYKQVGVMFILFAREVQ